QRVFALRDRELAERPVVEPELLLVALAEQTKRGRWPQIAERRRPFAVERPLPAVVLGDLRIRIEAEPGRREAGVERGRCARQRTGRRGAADVHGLTEIEFEAELIRGGLRPERVAGSGH